MRRADREITAMEDICAILDSCKVLHLAMCRDNKPYVVPLNFGYTYEDGAFVLYFHCAHEGKKLDWLRDNPHVCFEADCGHALITAQQACGYGYRFQSVIGSGTAHIVQNTQRKCEALACLMRHQTGKAFTFTATQADAVTVCEIRAREITAKAHK